MRDDQAERLIAMVTEATEYMRDMKILLEGNSKLGIEGLVRMVKRHDAWIGKAELKIAFCSGIGAALAFGIKYLFTGHL